MKFHGSGATLRRGYASACLEDVGIDRSPNTGFLGNCPGSLGTKLLARQVQERSPSTTSFREVISQLVDSDTVDPGWDGEPMDNAFIFARHVHGGQLLLHSNKGDLRGFESQHQFAQGSVTDTRTCLPKASKFLTSTLAQQTVPIGIDSDQSSFQSDMSGVIHAVRAYAPAESFKNNLNV